MAKQALNNIKLGIFVIAGLTLLVTMLYIIGKNASLFSSNFVLKARFRNIEGLTRGNNVRFSGIQAGTVKEIDIVNDTTIEVTMFINEELQRNIRKNSIVSIGSEGLMGNKVVNIAPGKTAGEEVEEGDILLSKQQGELGEALGTLYQTNENVSVISQELMQTIRNVNDSRMLSGLLNDTVMLADLQASLNNIKASSAYIRRSSMLIESSMDNMNAGKGLAGVILNDNDAGQQMVEVIGELNDAGTQARQMISRLDSIAAVLDAGINDREGLVYLLLRDTAFSNKLDRSMTNVERGTSAFSEDMEALKHNFLLRRYFKKQAKKNK